MFELHLQHQTRRLVELKVIHAIQDDTAQIAVAAADPAPRSKAGPQRINTSRQTLMAPDPGCTPQDQSRLVAMASLGCRSAKAQANQLKGEGRFASWKHVPDRFSPAPEALLPLLELSSANAPPWRASRTKAETPHRRETPQQSQHQLNKGEALSGAGLKHHWGDRGHC